VQHAERGGAVNSSNHEVIRVLVETTERSFKGHIHKPVRDERFRLSDHLNTYGKDFICLSDVTIHERGQAFRPGERRDFVAISTAAIAYITPMRDDEV
jgi:hypothetical protein